MIDGQRNVLVVGPNPPRMAIGRPVKGKSLILATPAYGQHGRRTIEHQRRGRLTELRDVDIDALVDISKPTGGLESARSALNGLEALSRVLY